jgi:hypothetical protein
VSAGRQLVVLLALTLFSCGIDTGPKVPIVLNASNIVDTNSLVPGYLGDPAWQVDPQGTERPAFTASASLGPDGLSGYVVDANPARVIQTAPGSILGPSFSRNFIAPEGDTFGAVIANVDIKMPAGAPAGTVKINITGLNETVIHATASLTTSGAWQTVSTASFAITPGTAYCVRVYVSGAHALIGRVSLAQSAPSDVWWNGTIKRTSAHVQDLTDNSFGVNGDERGGGQVTGTYYYVDPDSTYQFAFNGTRFAVELLTNNNAFGLCGLDVLVNGTLFTKVQGVNLLNNDIVSVTGLPAGAKTIAIQTAAQLWRFTYNSTQGAWLNAVYTDAGDSMTPIAPPVVGGGIVVFGTSKTAGFYAGGQVPSGDPSALGLIVRLRAGQSKRVIGKAIGGVSLYEERIACSREDLSYTGGSVMPMARDIIASKPSVFIIEVDHNDANIGWPSMAAWSTQYQLLLDTIKDAVPGCAIWMIYSTNDTTPPSNLAAYDAEQDVIASTRPWLGKLDLRTLWTSPQAVLHTVDGVHPDAGGYALIAAYILARI